MPKFSLRAVIQRGGAALLALVLVGVVAGSGARATTTLTWTARTAPEQNSWCSVAYGGGKFVAVSCDTYNDGAHQVMTSPDGVTWSPQVAAARNPWNSVTYGGGQFVAVASDGVHRVMTSPDGVTWTPRTAASQDAWNSVTYGNGKFVAVAFSGSFGRVMTSTDGATWSAATAPEANAWAAVIYGNGGFVAIASDGTHRVMTSTDGTNWTLRDAAEQNFWYALTYRAGTYVAGAYGGTHMYMTSPDGVTWTARAGSSSLPLNILAAADQLFVGLTYDNAGPQVFTSPDGVTWTSGASAEQNTWAGLAYGNGMFVAVANGGEHRIMTAPYLEPGATTTTVAPKSPTVKTSKTVSFTSIARTAKVTVPSKATLSVVVSKSSAKYCAVSRSSIKGLKAGTCRITLTVKTKAGKKTSKTITVKVIK